MTDGPTDRSPLPEGGPDPDGAAGGQASGARRGVLVGAAVAVAAVLVLVLVLTFTGDDDGTPGAAPSPTATGATPTGTPTAGTDPTDPPPSPEPTTAPGGEDGGEGQGQGGATAAPPTAGATPGPELQEALDAQYGDRPSAVVGRDADAAPRAGVVVRLAGVRATTSEATGPGQLAGDAVTVTVEVRNDGDRSVALDRASVNAFGPGGVPVSPLDADAAWAPLSGDLAPGASAEGTYVLVRPDGPFDVVVLVDLDSAVVVFEDVTP